MRKMFATLLMGISLSIFAAAPEPVSLVGPLDNFPLNAPSETPVVNFTWEASRFGVKPAFYILTLVEANSPKVIVGGSQFNATKGSIKLPKELNGKLIRWAVKACVPAKQKPECSKEVSRNFLWKTTVAVPRLYQPQNNASVLPSGKANFRWERVGPASSYLLCVTKPGVPCPYVPTRNADTTVIELKGSAATNGSINVIPLLNQDVEWTVAACNAFGKCAYQPNLNRVRVENARPMQRSPANGEEIGVRPYFSWSEVHGSDFYLLCVAKPGVTCPLTMTQSSDVVVTRHPQNSTHPLNGIPEGPDLTAFINQNVNWTVASCQFFAPAYVCEYQRNTRSATVKTRWNVGATMSIDVHDDCDNASDGDWLIRSAISRASLVGRNVRKIKDEPGAVDVVDWTSNGVPASVGSGSSRRFNRGIGISNVKEDDIVSLATAALDCDNNGIWTLVSPFSTVEGIPLPTDALPLVGFIQTIYDWTQTCGGEEFWESSGDNDDVGTAVVNLSPDQWVGARDREFTAHIGAKKGCGDDPFTARFRLTAVPSP